ncbi:DUF6531 domain-containing protein, partial [Myxococcus vastator]|uniref:DUF6531 domain-containing protein n=1 Tax=Myxococcus vastator TaxID=2709664 RepID=UPI001F07C3FC
LVDAEVVTWTHDGAGELLDFVRESIIFTEDEPLNDEMSVVHRPMFLMNEARQYYYYQGIVFEPGKVDPVYCRRDVTAFDYSTVPSMELVRTLPDDRIIVSGGQVHSSDKALGFMVTNRSSDTLHVRMIVQPNEPGDTIVLGFDELPRDGDGDTEVPPNTRLTRQLRMNPYTHGGRIRFELYANDYGPSSVVKVLQATGEFEVAAPPSGIMMDGLPLRARWVLPAWDFVSALKPTPGQPLPDDAQVPVADAAHLGIKVYSNGTLVVRRDGQEVASALVQANVNGIAQVVAHGGTPVYLGQNGYAVVELPPGAAGTETVRVTLVPENPNASALNREVPLTTTVMSVGRLPVSHTFVKDVSLVDGHLVKRTVDVEVSSRGVGLSWGRAYSSGDSDEGALGLGWTHTCLLYTS